MQQNSFIVLTTNFAKSIKIWLFQQNVLLEQQQNFCCIHFFSVYSLIKIIKKLLIQVDKVHSYNLLFSRIKLKGYSLQIKTLYFCCKNGNGIQNWLTKTQFPLSLTKSLLFFWIYQTQFLVGDFKQCRIILLGFFLSQVLTYWWISHEAEKLPLSTNILCFCVFFCSLNSTEKKSIT